MQKPWLTQAIIDLYKANGDKIPERLLEEQRAREDRSRRTWARYEAQNHEREDQDGHPTR